MCAVVTLLFPCRLTCKTTGVYWTLNFVTFGWSIYEQIIAYTTWLLSADCAVNDLMLNSRVRPIISPHLPLFSQLRCWLARIIRRNIICVGKGGKCPPHPSHTLLRNRSSVTSDHSLHSLSGYTDSTVWHFVVNITYVCTVISCNKEIHVTYFLWYPCLQVHRVTISFCTNSSKHTGQVWNMTIAKWFT